MDPDYISPPPAYSESGQEFDQKISQATALSLHTQASSTSVDSDGWPQYDSAAFEAAEGSSTSPTSVERPSQAPCPIETFSGKKDDYKQHGGIGGLSSVEPLRIEKKNRSKSLPKPPVIPDPWNQGSSTIRESSTPIVLSNHDDLISLPHPVQSTPVEDNLMTLSAASPVQQSARIAHKGDASPPPPPFEVQPPICLPESRPLDNHHPQQSADLYNVTRSQSPRQSLPIQSRPRFIPQERPMSSHSPTNLQPSSVPRVDFNPSIAYGRTHGQPATPLHPLKQAVQYDPHSFYNSAVSAQLTPVTTAGQHGHLSYTSYNSRNSFSPQRQYQQQGSPPRPGHYSQSYVSQDPLSSERSSALFEVNSPVLQSPASASSYSMSSIYQTSNTSPSPAYQYVAHTTNVSGNIYYDQQSPENRWSTR